MEAAYRNLKKQTLDMFFEPAGRILACNFYLKTSQPTQQSHDRK